MSTVTFTEQTPGSTASSTTQNANRSAWNTATASVDDANVRDEGLDHNSFADNVVETTRAGSAYRFVSDDGFKSALYVAASAVTINGSAVRIGPLTVASGDSAIIDCSALCSSPGTGTSSVRLDYSTDAVTWAAVGVTRRPIASGVNALFLDYTVVHKHALGAGTWYYRLYVETAGAAGIKIENAFMFARVIGH